ncbi:MAG TPA: biopolymer transporter ExbD [Planctomycetota bacterium]|nr:biopolymer transporter ExbD [Planctomycetota bacterium]
MAGASIGDNEENPVAINVTAMVDVIFCLCVFFMCSLHFRQLEGKFDTWLPKGKGSAGVGDSVIQEIRVAVYWDEPNGRVVRQLGNRMIANDEELQALIAEAHADFVKLNKPDTPVTIDADARVPWSEVINIVNICKRDQIDKIEFAMGAGPPQ